jgi:hypothetical protein
VGQVAATVDVGDVKDEGYTIEEADDDPTMPGVVKVNQRKRK